MCDSLMHPMTNIWSSDTPSSYDDLNLSGFDIDIGFQEPIPDIFQESTPELSPEFGSYPTTHEHVDLLSLQSVTMPELCDISNSHINQQQSYDDSGISSLPSSSSSPVQFDSWNYDNGLINVVPQAYEQPQFYETTFVNGRKRRACPDAYSMNTLPTDPTIPCMDFPAHPPKDLNGPGKPKRKRVQNARQRKAANVRERKRMFHLNAAFDSLKTKVPTFAYEKRLSRIETLRLAMTYISFMSELLEGKNPSEISLKPEHMDPNGGSFSLEDLEHLKQSIASSYISDGTESSESGSTSS